MSSFPVDESKLNESKIFKLLVLLEKKEELINSLRLILSIPHKNLVEYETYKSLNEVSYVDSNVIIDIVQNPEKLYETEKGIIEHEGKRYSPTAVLQYEFEESFDTPENRFVKHLLKELEILLSEELKDFFFLEELKEIKEEIEYTLRSDVFSEVGDLNFFPSNSQVLMKKAGYRELFQIYRLLHLSFVPRIFEDLDLAFSLKDMATLWEYYVLIEILREFKEKFGTYKVIIDFEEKVEGKTVYEEAQFKFENDLILYYQKSLYAYSGLRFRPDFYVKFKDNRFIFDAKFRIFENNEKDLLQNMHYYRDGLKVTSAVAVCFGEKNKRGSFWKTDGSKESINLFSELIENNFDGVGYIDLKLDMGDSKWN